MVEPSRPVTVTEFKMDEILTIPQVAAYLKLSKSKVYYMVSRKQIPHLRVGKNVRVKQADLMAWIENRTVKGL